MRERLGEPFRRISHWRDGLTCWLYNATTAPDGLSHFDGIGFCMSARHRVAKIELSVHG